MLRSSRSEKVDCRAAAAPRNSAASATISIVCLTLNCTRHRPMAGTSERRDGLRWHESCKRKTSEDARTPNETRVKFVPDDQILCALESAPT